MITLHVYWDGEPHAFRLGDGEHGVGRVACPVQIMERGVSKQHAMLRVEGERLFVRDLGSRNGTLLDGIPVGIEYLEVGWNAELFFANTKAQRVRPSILLQQQETADRTVFEPEQSYHPSDGYSDTARIRIVKLLSGLFEFLGSRENPETIEDDACRFVASCIKAERVLLLEDSGPGSPLLPIARWTPQVPSDEPIRLPNTIIKLVREQRRSVLIRDSSQDPRTWQVESFLSLNVQSAMAAPLLDNDRVRGILYVDSTTKITDSDTTDLQVLTAVANAVAVKLRNRSLEEGLRIAAEIQRRMLPASLDVVRGWDMAAVQDMCLAVGGDLYHCLPRAGDKRLLVLGDVSGKGMPAALAMSSTIGMLGLLAEVGGTLMAVTEHLHRQLWQTLQQRQFVTLFLGELDLETGDMTYANHGQELPIVVRADGRIEKLDPTGMPLALFETVPVKTAAVHLDPGDLLAVFSDGIAEATRDGEEFFGIEPLEDTLRDMRSEPLPAICARVRASLSEFVQGSQSSDDITLLLVRRA